MIGRAFGLVLGEAIQSVVSSDRWSVYNPLDLALGQLCWAHLKRDFRKGLERGGDAATNPKKATAPKCRHNRLVRYASMRGLSYR